jgi:hypothetical protein
MTPTPLIDTLATITRAVEADVTALASAFPSWRNDATKRRQRRIPALCLFMSGVDM